MRNLEDSIPGAPNFKYKEFVKSSAATRHGISNIPSDKEWENIEALAKNVIQPIREKFGPIRINSGYRSPELNVAIGGSPTSNHCRGEASDIEPWNEDTVTLVEMLEWIYKNLEFRTLILEYPPDGWLHIDYRVGGNTKTLKIKDKKHNYTEVGLDEIKKLYG